MVTPSTIRALPIFSRVWVDDFRSGGWPAKRRDFFDLKALCYP